MKRLLILVTLMFCVMLILALTVNQRNDLEEVLSAEAKASESGPASASANSGICGDVNDDFVVNPGDIVYLLNYLFEEGGSPICSPDASCVDANGDGQVDLGDILYLQAFLSGFGPDPIGFLRGKLRRQLCSAAHPRRSSVFRAEPPRP